MVYSLCEAEDCFLELIDGFHWEHDLNQYKNSLFGFKNRECLFELHSPLGLPNYQKIIACYRLGIDIYIPYSTIYFNDAKIWIKIASLLKKNYLETQSFIYDMTKKYLKMNPEKVIALSNISSFKSEQYFNNTQDV